MAKGKYIVLISRETNLDMVRTLFTQPINTTTLNL